jgi:hypothetical protein
VQHRKHSGGLARWTRESEFLKAVLVDPALRLVVAARFFLVTGVKQFGSRLRFCLLLRRSGSAWPLFRQFPLEALNRAHEQLQLRQARRARQGRHLRAYMFRNPDTDLRVIADAPSAWASRRSADSAG